ncbi:MAG: hypothetical protein V3T05_13570, partial [Myxococcota bacterium]
KTSDRGVPNGRDSVVFHGDLERPNARSLKISGADFTLCDCGDEPPSWRIDATQIEAEIGERAVLWWPQLHINLFGLGLIPITPPMAPLSVPLTGRAAGFLAPRILFLDSPWPMIDLPFFIPLGESWDVTLAPGIRSDWGRHNVTPVSTWGAPRLGGRLRYEPHGSTSGEANVQWTWDRKGQSARLYLDALEEITRDEIEKVDDAVPRKQLWLARRKLEHRVAVDWKHRTDFAERLTWLVDANWVSDDLVSGDFKITLDERVPGYMPSRTELLWRAPGLAGLLAADYLLAIRPSPTGDVSNVWDASNVYGAERATVHRGPAARFRVLPTAIGHGFYLDADASAVRYGPWVGGIAPALSVGGVAAGLAYRDRLGPVSIGARAAVDALWIDQDTKDDLFHVATMVDGTAGVRLARAFGDFIHVVVPGVSYRSIPWMNGGDSTAFSEKQSPSVDEKLQRRTFHQGSVVVDQALYSRGSSGPKRVARLVLSQPWDLETGRALQSRGALSLQLSNIASSTTWLDVDAHDAPLVQGLGTQLRLRLGPLSVSGRYSRWLPGADRFRRSIYELAAPAPPRRGQRVPSAWLHVASAALSAKIGTRVALAYRTDYLLAAPAPYLTERDTGIAEHVVSASYRSPCDCWEVSAQARIDPEDPIAFPKAHVTLTVGEYTVGN